MTIKHLLTVNKFLYYIEKRCSYEIINDKLFTQGKKFILFDKLKILEVIQ